MSIYKGNRGARGWQPPARPEPPKRPDLAGIKVSFEGDVAHVTGITTEDLYGAPPEFPKPASQTKDERSGAIDLVQVNGVWMTPEEAKR